MYMYYIQDDDTMLFLVARRQLGAPVPTCVWGDNRADAIAYGNIVTATEMAKSIGPNATVCRIRRDGTGTVKQIKPGGDGR